MKKKYIVLFILFIVFAAFGQIDQTFPTISISATRADQPEEMVTAIQILILMTVLTLAPSILVMTTSFTRIVIIFHFVKTALGIQQMPPNQVVIGLSLFLTFFVMAPTFTKIYEESYLPFSEKKITMPVAMDGASMEMKKFMLKQTGQRELELFLSLNKGAKPKTALDIPFHVVVPAFIISELRIAFQIGFILYLPFIIIDMVIASILMSMGMMMLPPMMISLPFKILLFVLVDGWYLLVDSIIKGYK
ncbi:MAG: flagellar type III secretion system pore protein FliP [Candidatus Delongbacteria bacterium]|nr:flagellar type III secretion system pore protein FliP [Candidatus Delongbacteria bacterium]MBN2835679.1 flagellar type III secretion system pore protein FliP [Candidatus Delongbacteria bacterium]